MAAKRQVAHHCVIVLLRAHETYIASALSVVCVRDRALTVAVPRQNSTFCAPAGGARRGGICNSATMLRVRWFTVAHELYYHYIIDCVEDLSHFFARADSLASTSTVDECLPVDRNSRAMHSDALCKCTHMPTCGNVSRTKA
jgi:hypothetical protein